MEDLWFEAYRCKTRPCTRKSRGTCQNSSQIQILTTSYPNYISTDVRAGKRSRHLAFILNYRAISSNDCFLGSLPKYGNRFRPCMVTEYSCLTTVEEKLRLLTYLEKDSSDIIQPLNICRTFLYILQCLHSTIRFIIHEHQLIAQAFYLLPVKDL